MMEIKTKKTMAKKTVKKDKRGHRSVKTKAIQKRYVGFFKNKYVRVELIPYLILSAMAHTVREEITSLYSMNDIAKVLRKRSKDDLALVQQELTDYVEHELPFIEGHSAQEIFNLLRIGATLLEGKKTPDGVPWQRSHKLQNAKHKAKYGKLMRYILNGKSDADWYQKTWFAFKEFIPSYDTELFVKLFALTSPRANFVSNLKLAFRAYEMFEGKISFAEEGFLGSTFVILRQFKTGGFTFQKGVRGSKRKVNNFALSILGRDHVTVDMWIGKAFAILSEYIFEGKRYPYTIRDSEYDVIETYIRGLSEVVGFEARQINAMIWLGIRQEEYNKHITSDTLALLLNALRKHGNAKMKAQVNGMIIVRTPVHLLNDQVECLDYTKPASKRVYLVRNSKPGSILYRTFDGKPHKHCSSCPFDEGCVMCTLP